MKKSKLLIVIYSAVAVISLVLSIVIKIDGQRIYMPGLLTLLSLHVWDLGKFNALLYVASALFCAVGGYLLGSTNFAILISYEEHNDDIRRHGSKNAGMTNMIRVYGKRDGIMTAVGDAVKTAAAVLVSRLLLGEFGAYLAGLFCVLGHIAPIWYKFKGGKGVITSAIAILILNPLYFLVVFAVFALVFFTSHYVSMGSVLAAFTYPCVVFLGAKISSESGTASPTALIFAFFVGAMVIIMHRDNIRRVYYGEENKMYLRKSSEEKQNKPKKQDWEV